jgi:hypothetical protein
MNVPLVGHDSAGDLDSVQNESEYIRLYDSTYNYPSDYPWRTPEEKEYQGLKHFPFHTDIHHNYTSY